MQGCHCDARDDIRKKNSGGYSPLAASLNKSSANDVSTCRWLIQNGAQYAFCGDDDPDGDIILHEADEPSKKGS